MKRHIGHQGRLNRGAAALPIDIPPMGGLSLLDVVPDGEPRCGLPHSHTPHSATERPRERQSATECDRVRQSATECHRVPQSATEFKFNVPEANLRDGS